MYPQVGDASPLAEVVERLADASLSDAPEVDLRTYKGLAAPGTTGGTWRHGVKPAAATAAIGPGHSTG